MNTPKILMNKYTFWTLAVLSIALIGAATYMTWGNSDYICTLTVEDEMPCVVDEWSQWNDTGTDPDPAPTVAGSVYTVMQRRLGTGTKQISQTIQYLHRRTKCPSGFNRTNHGKSGGDSGFTDDGTEDINEMFATAMACQIEESRTVRRSIPNNDPNGGGGNTDDPSGGDVVVGDVTTNITVNENDMSTTTIDTIDSSEEVMARRRALVAARIKAIPPLVRSGKKTLIKWRSQEAKYCDVHGANGDVWIHTAEKPNRFGMATSSPITAITNYKLDCIDFEDKPVSASTTVRIIANWNEQ